MTLDAVTKRLIEQSNPFILFLPDTPVADTEGEASLEYAISLRKHIVVWRKPGMALVPLPVQLDTYADLKIIDGPLEDLKDAMEQYWEILPGDAIEIHRQGF